MDGGKRGYRQAIGEKGGLKYNFSSTENLIESCISTLDG